MLKSGVAMMVLAAVILAAFIVAVLERYGNTHHNWVSKSVDALFWWPLSIALVLGLIVLLALALWLVMTPALAAIR